MNFHRYIDINRCGVSTFTHPITELMFRGVFDGKTDDVFSVKNSKKRHDERW